MPSLHSYWHNIYYHEDTSLESKIKTLLSYFVKDSIKTLRKRLEILESQSFYTESETLRNLKKINSLEHVKTIDAFFEADKFKGNFK